MFLNLLQGYALIKSIVNQYYKPKIHVMHPYNLT
jgi:hypothetical protein